MVGDIKMHLVNSILGLSMCFLETERRAQASRQRGVAGRTGGESGGEADEHDHAGRQDTLRNFVGKGVPCAALILSCIS